MKNKVLLVVFGALAFSACNQKEMKVSRSDFSIVTEMNDFSPGYIDKDKNRAVELNRSNFIGNTHWVLSVNRDLTLGDISQSLQKLTDKKHAKGGMHDDSKDIYFVYSDTVHKQNAYVKLPFRKIALNEPPVYELSEGTVSLLIKSVDDVNNASTENVKTVLTTLDKNMKVETFVNVLIQLEKQKVTDKLNEEVYID